MASDWLASMLIHPFAIGLLVGVVLLSAAVLYLREDSRPPMGPGRLAAGYAGAILFGLVMAAASSYVPREEALTKWHVLAEDYWLVSLRSFLGVAILLIYTAVFGIAVVGAPVVFAMSRRGWGTIPKILLASVAISLVFFFVLVLLTQSPGPHFWRGMATLVGMHLILALGFCIGSRMPWREK